MSYRRIFSLREFALCLVILANAIGLGAVILTTAVSASSTLEKVAAEASADTPALAVERVDQGKVGTVDVDAANNTTTETTEALPELSSGEAAVNEQISVQVVEAPVATATAVTEESSVNLSLVDTTNDSLTQIPGGGNMVPAQDAGVVNEEDALSDPTPLNASTPESASLSTTTSPNPVIEPTTLEAAKTLLKTDYDELLESGLDFSATIKEIDLMAESDRYGEFGRR
jgi:hypothetical protein